jgi:Skp family chaperone for outer membrane proteins
MMAKRFLTCCMALVLGVSALMADAPSDFINKYELFVDGVAALDKDNTLPETMDSLKCVYKELTKEYKSVKKQMTQIQLEKYYNLKAKYQKTVAVWKTKRGAKAVGGWVKGVVGKKKKS